MSNDPFDSDDPFDGLFDDTTPINSGRGGARSNAGRKTAKERQGPKVEAGEPTLYQKHTMAKIEREQQLARQAKVKADIEEGVVVLRESVRVQSARAFAVCSQALDSIGDMLERDGHPVEVSLRVMELVNAAKQQLAIDLEKIHTQQ